MSQTDGINFVSIRKYILSCKSVSEIIATIDKIILDLFLLAADPETTNREYISEYSMDDGQMKVKAVYKDISSIMTSIEALNKMRTYYVNKSTGRSFRLIDGKNFTGNSF